MTDDFFEVTKEGVERVYTTFVSKVAQGRNMTFEEVDAIAQGSRRGGGRTGGGGWN